LFYVKYATGGVIPCNVCWNNSILIKKLTKGMSGRRSLLDAVQLAETLGTTRVRARCHQTFNRRSHDWALMPKYHCTLAGRKAEGDTGQD
ncbi:hypothetical protein HAX54_042233, partial [Datura stramonium]|nr:hypothetical protein [Datura stramonium]